MEQDLLSTKELLEFIVQHDQPIQKAQIKSQNGMVSLQIENKNTNIQQNKDTRQCFDLIYGENDLLAGNRPILVSLNQRSDNPSIEVNKFDKEQVNKIVVEKYSGGKKEKRVIQHLEKNGDYYLNRNQLDVSEYHGKIIQNVMIGELSIHKNHKIVYCAQIEPQEHKSIFEWKGNQWPSQKDQKQMDMQYKDKQNFGEDLEDVYEIGIFIWDYQLNTLHRVKLDDQLIAMTPQLVELDGQLGVIFGALNRDKGIQRGILHCLNREAQIYLAYGTDLHMDHVNQKKDDKDKDTPDTQNSRLIKLSDQNCNWKPIVDNQDKYLIFIESPHIKAHSNYFRMVKVDLQRIVDQQKIEKEILIDIEDGFNRDSNFTGLTGLFSEINTIQFSQDHKSVFFQTLYGFSERVYQLDIDSKQVKCIVPEINEEGQMDCWNIILNQNGYLVISYSTYSSLQEQYFIYHQEQKKLVQLNIGARISNERMDGMDQRLKKIKQHNLSLESEGELYSEAILLENDEKEKGTVVVLHGGPHSNGLSSRIGYKMMLLNGLNVLTINYTGSLGYGQKAVEQLLGKIGDIDIKQIEHFIKQSKQMVENNKIGIIGGSYGGYLGFRVPQLVDGIDCVVSMNPVTDIFFNKSITDIPEWNYVESNAEIGWDQQIHWDNPFITKQLKDSPVYNQIIDIPQLLILGKKDKRVPYQQGLYYYDQAVKKGVEIECHVYDNSNHSLADSVHTRSEVLLRSISYLIRKLR